MNLTRRRMLQLSGGGFGALALNSLLHAEGALSAPASTNPLAAHPPHFAPRAKSVIFLFMWCRWKLN